MKKVLVVLLIAVLAVSAVFADSSSFTGKLTTTLKYDLKDEAFTLKQDAKVTASFAFALFDGSLSGANKGEGYPYAEVEGALSLAFDDFAFSFGNVTKERLAITDADTFWGNAVTVDEKVPVSGDEAPSGMEKYDVRVLRWAWSTTKDYKVFTKANIIGENWSVDLLKNAAEGNFATDTVGDTQKFTASKKVSKTVAFDFNNSVPAGDGVSFTYDGYTVSVNQFTLKDSGFDFALTLQSKDLEVAEGLTVTAGANYQVMTTNAYSVNPSVKVAYDANDVNAVVAADFSFSDADPEYDVSLDADYLDEAVAFDFYYATTATAKSPYSTLTKLQQAVYTIKFDYTGDNPAYTVKYANSDDGNVQAVSSNVVFENFMSAKAVVDVAKLADLGPVSALSVAVDGHDVLNKENAKHAWNVEANAAVDQYGTTAKFGVKKFTVDARTFYAEATTDFAKFAELPVNSLTLTVGSNDLDMDKNVADDTDCLYVAVESEINDDLTVGVTGNYLAGKGRTDKIGVEATYTGVENLTVSASASRDFAKDVATKKTVLEASAKYTCDLFTATGLIQSTIVDENETDSKVGAYVGVESTKLVNGATIGLYYSELDKKGNVTSNWTDPATDKDYFAAVCTLAF